MNIKHCSIDESCQSIVFSDARDISFGGYIVGTPINIVHGMWFVLVVTLLKHSINIVHGMWFALVVTLLKHQLTLLMLCGSMV